MTSKARTTPTRRPAKRRSGSRKPWKVVDEPRVILVAVAFALLGAFLIGVVIDLQAVRPDRYRSLGEDQRTLTRSVAAFRGSVVDRNGFVLAASSPSQNLIADPQSVPKPVETARALAPILEMDAAALEELLIPDHDGDKYALLSETIPDEAVQAVRDLNEDSRTTHLLKGIVLRPQEERIYPGKTLAAPIVGRVNGQGSGRSGLERHYDDLLTGTPGRERVESSGFGLISVGKHQFEPAAEGYDVELTLDHRVQFVAEEALINTCQKLGAKGATAVVTVPQTGEVLVMANVTRRDDGTCGVAGYNASVMDTFEPGSVIKPLTVAGAVEELGYEADSKIFVPDRIRVSDKTFADHPPHPPADFTLAEVMAQSMNVGVIELGAQIGPTRFYNYATGFGIGKTSGADIPGEVGGRLREPQEWKGSDAGSIVIGQGLTVNTLQLAAAYGALANDGLYLSPTLVRGITGPDGERKTLTAQTSRQVVSAETTAEVSKMLMAVVAEDATGEKAQVPGYTVAGKTGTAWKVFDNGSGKFTYGSDNDRRYVTTFAGYAPADDPQLAVVVVVDEPRTATSATTAAAPVWSEITGYALRILEVAPATKVEAEKKISKVRGTPASAPEPLVDPEGVQDAEAPAPTPDPAAAPEPATESAVTEEVTASP